MARHRADKPPIIKRRISLSLAVLAGAPLLALGPVTAATAADTPPGQIQTIQNQTQSDQNQIAVLPSESLPTTASDVGTAALGDTDPLPEPVDPDPVVDPVPVDPTPVPVDPTPVPVDPTPVPVDPTPVPVDPTPVPVDPTPVPVDPTPVPTPVDPAPVDPAPAQPAPVQPAPWVAPVAVDSPVSGAPAQANPSLTVTGSGSGAVTGSRAAAVQGVPVEQLAYTGSTGSEPALAGLALGLMGAGTVALVLGRGKRSPGRRAATA